MCNAFISSRCSSRQSISYYKKTQEEKTFSNIEKLNRNERIVEIAKMTDGNNPSKFALEHAEKSLAENFKY